MIDFDELNPLSFILATVIIYGWWILGIKNTDVGFIYKTIMVVGGWITVFLIVQVQSQN